MTYSKPEINTLAIAIKAIEGVQKGAPFVTDNARPHNQDATISAYEADE